MQRRLLLPIKNWTPGVIQSNGTSQSDQEMLFSVCSTGEEQTTEDTEQLHGERIITRWGWRRNQETVQRSHKADGRWHHRLTSRRGWKAVWLGRVRWPNLAGTEKLERVLASQFTGSGFQGPPQPNISQVERKTASNEFDATKRFLLQARFAKRGNGCRATRVTNLRQKTASTSDRRARENPIRSYINKKAQRDGAKRNETKGLVTRGGKTTTSGKKRGKGIDGAVTLHKLTPGAGRPSQ